MGRRTPYALRWLVPTAMLLPIATAQEDESSGPSSNTTIIAVCVVAGVVAVLFVAGALVVCIKKRRARKPSRHRGDTNPYGQMGSPQLEAQLDAAPRGRARGQQPSTMYNDLNRAISDIFGSGSEPPKSQPHYASRSQLSLGNASQSQLGLGNASRSQLSLGYASRSQLSFGYGMSQEPNPFASNMSLSPPDAVYLAGASTTSLNDPSKGYHYKRRQHSDPPCTLSKPMERKSVSDAPFPRPLVTKSPSYPPPGAANEPAYASYPPTPGGRPLVSKRPSYPPTSSSETSSSPERILTPPSMGKGRRKMPPAYEASYAEADPASFDRNQPWPNDYTEVTDYMEPQAQPPVAAMFPKKQSIVELSPLAPISEPVIYDKDYAQLERTRIAPPAAHAPPGAQSQASVAHAKAEEASVALKLAQQQAAHAKMVSFSDATPYATQRSQKKSDREAFHAAMKREGNRSARRAWERLH